LGCKNLNPVFSCEYSSKVFVCVHCDSIKDCDEQNSVWLTHVKIYQNITIQIQSNNFFKSAIYYVCILSKVDVSMGKTWISPNGVSSYNPPSTLQPHQMASAAFSLAEYTVRVRKLLLRNSVQAHDNCLEVLPHINLYLSMRRHRTLGCPGHVTPSYLKFCISKNSVFQDQDIFSKNRQKSSKKIVGLSPHPFLTGLRPSHPPR